ncbi:MAG TPA: glycosyltransferase [Burkholderiaceae bacterium]|nr:glycosyltransferase [Burkholderiaceae bacterium]
MRIAMISEHASPLACLGGIDAGGQNVYVAQVARELARLGHQVDVLTRRDDPSSPPVVDFASGVRVVHVPAGPPSFVPKEDLLQYMPAFARTCRDILAGVARYDVVHANFFMSGQVALSLKRWLGMPVVETFHALGLVRREHQGSADLFPPSRIGIERRIVRLSDALIAECPQDRSDLVRLYGARERKITMVPCGVDLSEFSPIARAAARAALGLDPDEFIVLQLGRLVPRKGIDNVIRAMPLIGTGARVLVVGGDAADADETLTPEIARLRRVAADCGVGRSVMFTGHRSRKELRLYYAAADVFVTTPWYEPFGITPLEAMACARPVVGSAVGGIKYSVDDGVTGLLVPPRDPTALAAALLRLRRDPQWACEMGRAGRARVASQFTWSRVAAELARVYRRVQPLPSQRPVRTTLAHGAGSFAAMAAVPGAGA